MASLTHVRMWDNNDWVPITAEEAARLHPGGTVSAYSGLFMCDLCGQFVTLTDGDIRIRYFKHSAYEKSKDCPERTFGFGYRYSYPPQEHELPIRITVKSSSFSFEVGLIPVPISFLKMSFRLEIRPKGAMDTSYVFTKERLFCDRITYLPIGERPFEKFILNFEHGNDKLHEFWPTEITGIDPKGTLFDKATGKKILYDADVEIEKEYYLLTQGGVFYTGDSVQVQELFRKQIQWARWRLYVVSASAYSENAARFFLNYHCRLTDKPISLQPVWPLFIEGNYLIKHDENSVYMLVTGNVSAFKTFPSSTVLQLNKNTTQPKLYKVFCSSRQQLISVGRTRALQYTYFWKESLAKVGPRPKIQVSDLAGAKVAPGKTNTLPPKRTLCFKSKYDGRINIIKQNHIVDIRTLTADKCVEIDGLAFGISIQVVIGLDIIWQIDLIKQQIAVSNDEMEILEQITNVSGPTIPAPHSLRNILANLSQYPQISRWIQKCITDNTIKELSYRRLQKFYLSIK